MDAVFVDDLATSDGSVVSAVYQDGDDDPAGSSFVDDPATDDFEYFYSL